MLQLYEEGYDIVSPRRISRSGETWFKKTSAALFYRVMKKMVDPRLAEDVGDFRLFSSRAVAALRRLREQHRFMRGMVAWLGLRETVIPFERQARAAGTTKYPLWKMIRFCWTAITSFSAIPLQMTLGLGIMSCGLAFCYLTYALISAIFYKDVVWGWTSVVFLQCFFFGITLICLGLIGDYVAKIYEESKGRPLYVVGQAFNTIESPLTERAIIIEPMRASKTQAR
jgi:dolichol-phosphate mannosyltransferase